MGVRVRLFAAARPEGVAGALRDALAGVTLASMNVPQVLGYTRIAGTPVVTGLYTAMLPPLAFALFGSSRHLVVAADSATAAILSGSLPRMAEPGSADYVALASMVALLTAGLLVLARVFRLGFLADFLSRTVLAGFLTGVGIQVGVAMLGDMLDVTVTSHTTLRQVIEIAGEIGHVHPAVAGLALPVAAAILLGRRLIPRWPVPLVVVLGMIGASAAFGFAERGIPTIGAVPGGLPDFGLPWVRWRTLLDLLPVAGSCFVMIVAQSAATARAFAAVHGERHDEDADLLGLAAANAAAGLSGTFVVNGSPTQTAMADAAGARSQVAQMVFAVIVAAVLLFFTGPLQYLPRCVLAAIVFTIGMGMIDWRGLRAMGRESPGELRLALLTAASVIAIGVEQGILIAIALSLLRHVRHSYRPHAMVLVADKMGQWEPVAARPGVQTEAGLIVYRFGADLFFANADRFAEQLRALIEHAPVRPLAFVIDASAITDIDYSAARIVRTVFAELDRQGTRIVLARVSPFLQADLVRHGVMPFLGPGCVFTTLHQAVAAARAFIREEGAAAARPGAAGDAGPASRR